MSTKTPEKSRPRGVYLLPNLFTTGALFSGFYAIVSAMKGNFEIAAIAIFVAFIADGLDGRVARMTNTQTAFGAEYDSLSDMVAFGLAPALIIYSWSLHHLGKIGWCIAFVYTAATALRLARFNTQIHDVDKRYFQGLPSPSAAGLVASLVWVGSNLEIDGVYLSLPASILTLAAAILMVSHVRYYSFKQVDVKRKVPFVAAVVIILALAAIAMEPECMLFGLFFVFMCSGPVMTLWQLRMARRLKKKG